MDTIVEREDQMQYYKDILRAEMLEDFLGKRFSGAKRFSLEGGESGIPALRVLLSTCSSLGVEYIHMGMAHRGRLNILTNVLKTPLHSILSQFQPYLPDEPDFPNNSDDVR